MTNERANEKEEKIAASVRGLRLKFPGETGFIFKDLSLTVAAGEKVLLLGPSGCGKSTLLQVLGGLIPGTIEVPMKSEYIHVPAAKGYVFQDPDTQFCMPYVDEELAFVLENRAVPREWMGSRMRTALGEVGLHLEDLHVPIERLSQGMKQRLALASVLLLEPEVIFLDEPSALLDPEGRWQIWEAVRRAAEGRTLIVVEHRTEEIADWVDRVVLFASDGSIISDGCPRYIFTRYRRELEQYGIWHPGAWERYFGSEGRWVMEDIPSVHREEDTKASVISLKQFAVWRGKEQVVEVARADIYPGDFIAVTGPNGAGKSSLLLGLAHILRTTGNFLLLGEETGRHGKKKRNLHEIIGFVFQNPEFQFVADTVLDEALISVADQEEIGDSREMSAIRLLSSFRLDSLKHRHPYQLSLGQKRRLSLLSAAGVRRPIILLDEPTFGQDAGNTMAIVEWCEHMRQSGAAIVMVTHEVQIAERVATHIWEFHRGKLVSQRLSKRQEMGGGLTRTGGSR